MTARIVVPLDGKKQERWFYGVPTFQLWLDKELKNLLPGRLKAPDPPEEQVDNWLFRWMVGEEIRYDRQLNDLMPGDDEVWEAKTPDIRIFGWICKPKTFIAVFGDYADHYKPPTRIKSYGKARQRVIDARDRLKLDNPKYAVGTFDELVRV